LVAVSYELRVFVPGGIYHVASRGSNRGQLFSLDEHRELFLSRLERALDNYELPCLAYCLMDNHYHLIVQTPDARLSAAMQELNGGYSRSFNRLHCRSAHLFRTRFMARLIESDSHLLTACRYLAHNPVRAGLCATPSEWQWSSYRATVGIEPPPGFLNEMMIRGVLGGGEDWRTRYRAFVESIEPVEPPPGSEKFPF
jgi:putative transposase